MNNSRANFLSRVLLATALLSSVSCRSVNAPDDHQRRISGTYLLTRVNGQPLPATVQLATGCTGTVKSGTLTLGEAGVESRPPYGWAIGIDLSCTPAPAGAERTDDAGWWSFSSGGLVFSSAKPVGNRGDYQVGLDESSSPPVVTMTYAGGAYQYSLVERADAPKGVVFLKVTDQFGAPVAGVLIYVAFPNGLTGGGQTPSSGEFGTKGIAGEWKITLVPPSGYTLPGGQPNPFPVTVTANSSQTIALILQKG